MSPEKFDPCMMMTISTLLTSKKLWCLSITILTQSLSWVSAQNSSNGTCALDFNAYPYKPIGECLGESEELNQWGSIKTTRCCRNALNTLAQSLATRSKSSNNGSTQLFLAGDEWESCRLPVADKDQISIDGCNFGQLYSGSSLCTSLSLDFFRKDLTTTYQQSVDSCSQLSSPSFGERCEGCESSIMGLRDAVLDSLQVKNNGTEAKLCVVTVVVAVAAAFAGNDTKIVDDFYRCLPVLDTEIGGYIRIKSYVAKVILAMLIAMMGLLLIILLVKFYMKRKKKTDFSEGEEKYRKWSGMYRFSKGEIESALHMNGSPREPLGSGSAGSVYKGRLPSGQVVAIKHIYNGSMSDSFTREVEGFMKYRHPNLVSLLGYCLEGGEKYLVYEYCPKGNLAQGLLRHDSVLSWEKRVNILRDCALALRYLHSHPDGAVIHRDIKLTNILLTENMDPKLSDFGLARMVGMEETKVFTEVKGTLGYMDPEYVTNAKLTLASDVYSFGIVALQILSGKRVFELDVAASESLTKIATDVKMNKRPQSDFEDPKLNGNLNSQDFRTILELAVLCAARSSRGRPSMDEVFKEIDKICKNRYDAHKQENTWSNSTNSIATPTQRGTPTLMRV